MRWPRAARPFESDGPAARARLLDRGLDADQERGARALIERLRQAEPPTETVVLCPEQEELATEALWNWYLQWSQISRKVIKNRTLIRALGFSAAPRALRPGAKCPRRPERPTPAGAAVLRRAVLAGFHGRQWSMKASRTMKTLTESLLVRLDRFENKWFPLTRAVRGRRFPQLGRQQRADAPKAGPRRRSSQEAYPPASNVS